MNHDKGIVQIGYKRTAAVAALLFMMVVVAAIGYYVRQSRVMERRQETYAALLLDMAENGMRAHLRGANYHPEHLEDWFLGLMVSAQLGGICLEGDADEPIMALGIYVDAEDARQRNDYIEVQRMVDQLESLSPRRGWRHPQARGAGLGPGRGAGPGGRTLPPGPFTFTLALDKTPMQEAQAVLRLHVTAILGLGGVCAALFAALFLLWERQMNLHVQLAGAKEQASRQAMLAQLGAGLAHETKNPLGLIRGMAQGIRDQTNVDKTTRKRLADIIDETDRVTGRIDSFLSFAKPIEPDAAPVAAQSLFADLEALLRDEAAAGNITLTTNAEKLVVLADAELLRRALLNLLLNAFKACRKGGEVYLEAKRHDDHGRIVVRDTGIGIDAEDLPHITTPYFSRFDEGVGLGLALTEEIVRAHGWQLTFASAPGEGTTAQISDIILKEPQDAT